MTTLSLDKKVEEIQIKHAKVYIFDGTRFNYIDEEKLFNKLLDILYYKNLCSNLEINYFNLKEVDIEKALKYYLSLSYSNIH